MSDEKCNRTQHVLALNQDSISILRLFYTQKAIRRSGSSFSAFKSNTNRIDSYRCSCVWAFSAAAILYVIGHIRAFVTFVPRENRKKQSGNSYPRDAEAVDMQKSCEHRQVNAVTYAAKV